MLFDELYASTFPDECGYLGLRRMREAVVFDITAVARYAERTYHDGGRPVDMARDLPTVAPPAPVCWLEYDCAGRFGPDRRRLAVLLTYQELQPQWRPEGYPDARWLLDTFPVLEHADRSISVDDFVLSYLLDEQGALLSQGLHDYAFQHVDAPDQHDEQVIANVTKSFAALLAVCFSHVHGVVVRDQQQPRQQRRAWTRAGHARPLVAFRTVDIDPVVRRMPAGPRTGDAGLRHALCYVRGHLRHYPPGTYMGRKAAPATTVYIPLHLRGSSDEGVRFHDYRVHAPGEEVPCRSDT